VTDVTLIASRRAFNVIGGERVDNRQIEREDTMLIGIIVTLIITSGLGYAVRAGGGRSGLIARRPYNNRYNDAAGAREDHLG
jgi:hypothetical protein